VAFRPAGAARDMISVRELIKRFDGKTVFDGLSLDVPAGETHVVIGPSGAGKSCLLRCIAGLEPFEGGGITVGETLIQGHDHAGGLNGGTLRRARRNVGFVFQQFNLFPHRTALENIMEGPVQVQKLAVAQAEAQARRLLEKVHLHDKAGRRPHQLSGGEQQRVAIARALAMQPKCLLFDEPTSALDPEMVGEVLQVVRELAAEGMTLLIVTHEMQFAREVAHRVVMLDGGRVVETGPPQQVIQKPKEERTKKFLQRIFSQGNEIR